MSNKYKQYRVVNKKGPVSEFLNGIERSKDKKNSLNKVKPFVPHWIEYREVDEFKIEFDNSLVPEPLNGEKLNSLCCRCFALPEKPETIAQAYMDNRRWAEIDKIAPMIIHLGEFTCNPLKIGDPEHKLADYYTCKNFKDGECTDYENRPEMCSSFTYQKEYCEQCTTMPTCNGCKERLSDETVKSKEVAA